MARRDGVTVKVIHNDIPEYAASIPARCELVTAKAAMDIQAGSMRETPVDTGFLRNSHALHRIALAHYRITVGAHYAIYVHEGTRYMAGRPFLRTAADRVRPVFRAAIAKALGAK
jgi:HK97 gp10 family phage protein